MRFLSAVNGFCAVGLILVLMSASCGEPETAEQGTVAEPAVDSGEVSSATNSGSPGARLVAAMELIRDGNANAVQAMVVDADQSGAAMFFGVYSSGWTAEGGLESVEVLREEIEGDLANVDAEFHFANGVTEEVSYELMQEDGEWKLRLP